MAKYDLATAIRKAYEQLSATQTAVSANKLQSPRQISLQGDATGSANFDGSQDATITVQVQDNSHAHTIDNVAGLSSQLAEAQSRIAELESWPKSGSTTSTTWIKHRDGTMVATSFLNSHGVAIQTAVGAGLFQSTEVVNIPLPVGFVSRPAYSVSVEYVSGSVRPIAIPVSSSASAVACVLQSGTSTPSVVCNFVVTAVGRWK